jgi:hypothetical protein
MLLFDIYHEQKDHIDQPYNCTEIIVFATVCGIEVPTEEVGDDG